MPALVDTSTYNIVEENQASDEGVWNLVTAKTDNIHRGGINEATGAVMVGDININVGHDVFGDFTAMLVS
jgi:hypothetical protein